MDFYKWHDSVRSFGVDIDQVDPQWLVHQFSCGQSPVTVAKLIRGGHFVRKPIVVAPPTIPPVVSPRRPISPINVALACGAGGLVLFSLIQAASSGSSSPAQRQSQNFVAPPESPTEKAAREKALAEAAEKAKLDAERKAWIRQEEKKRGAYPIASAWDGITPEVNDYLRVTLRDYKSMELVNCYEVLPYGEDAWAQQVQYRAKNGFGGTNNVTQIFVIRNGSVIDVVGDSR
jgi:hypothetical protein